MNPFSESLEQYLVPTTFLDFGSPVVQEYVHEFRGIESTTEQAIALYGKVRDGFLYDPYHLNLQPKALVASAIIGKSRAWCVEKAIVCCAGLRALGIPARLGYGIVKNHVGVEKLVHYLQKEEIVFHGYVEAFLQNRWVKCTPAFDRRICRVSGVEPLEWDGRQDSLFQAYQGDRQFMEYVHFYGAFSDVPVVLMHCEMHVHYPHLFTTPIATAAFSFKFESDLVPDEVNALTCETPVISGSSNT